MRATAVRNRGLELSRIGPTTATTAARTADRAGNSVAAEGTSGGGSDDGGEDGASVYRVDGRGAENAEMGENTALISIQTTRGRVGSPRLSGTRTSRERTALSFPTRTRSYTRALSEIAIKRHARDFDRGNGDLLRGKVGEFHFRAVERGKNETRLIFIPGRSVRTTDARRRCRGNVRPRNTSRSP